VGVKDVVVLLRPFFLPEEDNDKDIITVLKKLKQFISLIL